MTAAGAAPASAEVISLSDERASVRRRLLRGRAREVAALPQGQGMDALRRGDADAITYGSLYIANPDLVARFKADAPLMKPDPATFYGSGPKGYTDYPALSAKDKAA
jgi:N-ethylmaleimide reductase